MNPIKWGKFLWISIHLIALGYPNNPSEEEKKDYHNFYTSLYKVLPCVTCSEHLVKNLQEHPLHANILTDSKSLFTWTVELHNIVNKQLGKKQMPMDKALAMYNSDDLSQYICKPCVTTFEPKEVQNTVETKVNIYLLIILCISILINIYYFGRIVMRRLK
jgi:hypothetical protein